jgi:UDPglucose 6-dehydrogenase
VDATIKSNVARKAFIVRDILGRVKKGATIGIYRLVMKQGSDNFRSSAVMDIIDELKKAGAKLIIYEPTVSSMNGVEIIQSLDEFIACADLIIANRVSPEIKCCAKLYTRDIFCEN